jgi:hypothetical protein
LHTAVRRALCRRIPVGASILAAALAAPLTAAAPFPSVFRLGSLYPAGGGDGSQGFVLTGASKFDYVGASVNGAGDVNGDGLADVIVGSFGKGRSLRGDSYVVFGARGFSAVIELESLLPENGGDGTAGFVLSGIDPYDYSGRSVSAAGDINGDGIGDLIVGAERADPGNRFYAGESYVVFGSAQGFPAQFPLAMLFPSGGGNGSRGFVLTGIAEDDHAGAAVSAAGDINADGIDDLIVGAYSADPGGRAEAGESYVVFGSRQAFPAVIELASLEPENGGDGSKGFVIAGVDDGDYSGFAVSAGGDLNGDGVDDLIIGAVFAERGDLYYSGESYIVFGSSQRFPAVFPLANLFPGAGGDGSRGVVLTGVDTFDLSGDAVSAAGDFNADGIDDLIIGAILGDPNGHADAGESYVVFGSPQFPAMLPLSSLYPAGGGDGSRGVVLAGIDMTDWSGRSVNDAGDVNHDGISDVIVGAILGDPLGKVTAGESYVVFGSTQPFPAVFPLASLYRGGGIQGFVLAGAQENDWSGNFVSGAGDVNGDGIDDVIVGAYRASPEDHFAAGASFVVFGRGSGN